MGFSERKELRHSYKTQSANRYIQVEYPTVSPFRVLTYHRHCPAPAQAPPIIGATVRIEQKIIYR